MKQSKAKKNNLIKSRERVEKFAEVFTPPHIVKDMCDLIPQEEWAKIDATFLEPACGNGNFLVEILARKLELCKTDEEIIRAYQSIYGIDIQADNVLESRCRMFLMCNGKAKDAKTYLKIADILAKNIICGDSLKIMKEWQEEVLVAAS